MNLQNIEHEQMILGAIMRESDILDDYVLYDDMFTDKNNKDIFKAIKRLKEKGYDIDLISVTDESKVSAAYCSEITSLCFGNYEYYYDSLLELLKKRKLVKVATNILNNIEHDYNLLVSGAEKDISEIDSEVRESAWVKDIVPAVIEDIESIHNGTKDFGIKPRTAPLDSYVPGFVGGELIILAARPSIGKTGYAIQLALNISMRGIECGFISLEMTKEAIVKRIISNLSMTNLNDIRKATYKTFDSITAACEKLQSCYLMIDDSPNIYLNELRIKARKMVKNGAKIIFIDYLTLISHEDSKLPKNQQVGEISKALKQLARVLKVPIVCLSQIRRDAENKVPSLADLRWSGDIEQDADIVIFLHGDRESSELKVIIAKQRNGALGSFDIHYDKSHQIFYAKEF